MALFHAEGRGETFPTESGRYVVYARVTDKAGNQTIINSDGVVVFKTLERWIPSIDYTRTTKASVDAKVKLNGNTIASVNGRNHSTEGRDYIKAADRIHIQRRGIRYFWKQALINRQRCILSAGRDRIQRRCDKPADSQIAVNVSRQTANVKNHRYAG